MPPTVKEKPFYYYSSWWCKRWITIYFCTIWSRISLNSFKEQDLRCFEEFSVGPILSHLRSFPQVSQNTIGTILCLFHKWVKQSLERRCDGPVVTQGLVFQLSLTPQPQGSRVRSYLKTWNSKWMGLWKSPRAERYRGRMRVLWKDKWHWVSEVWWRRVSLLWAQKPTWKTRARWDSWTLAFIKFLNCIVIFMHERCMCVIAHLWRPEDNLHMLVLTFHLVGPKFSCRHIYLLSPLVSPVKLVYMYRGMRVFMYITCMCECICMYIHVHVYTYVYECMYLCVWVYVFVCACVHMYMYMCACKCMFSR